MITLFTFGRLFGLPDPSPFVAKAEVLLKMSGLPYRTDTSGFNKAPKGKLPYIDDDGTIVADSTFIRWHLEMRHGTVFDTGLTDEQKGIAWAVEKLCEDNLYWVIVDSRWIIDPNFDKGPRAYFKDAPALVRPLITGMVRRKVRRDLQGQGLGRHPRAEIERIAAAGFDAISRVLGPKPWLLGNAPCGVDATVWAFVTSAMAPHFDGPIRASVVRHANLAAYVERGYQRWYPELAGKS